MKQQNGTLNGMTQTGNVLLNKTNAALLGCIHHICSCLYEGIAWMREA